LRPVRPIFPRFVVRRHCLSRAKLRGNRQWPLTDVPALRAGRVAKLGAIGQQPPRTGACGGGLWALC